MAQYRKKPVVIEAIQYNNINKEEIEKFVGVTLRTEVDSYHYDQGLPIPPKMFLFIATLEGEMRVDPMDYVIKGVKGEFYPCKPDIFEQTYELADGVPTPPSAPNK